MIQSLMDDVFVNGEKFKIIPINRLMKLEDEMIRFKQTEYLNGFQKWITDNLYSFKLPDVEFSIKSIILIAIPHPFYAKVEFINEGRKYHCLSLVISDFQKTEERLKYFLLKENFQINETLNLPLKRLAVQSGLAVYGRNNICYIAGMGSSFSFTAFFSDIPAEDGCWMEVKTSPVCTNCNICLTSCPTGAIRKERF